MKAALLFLFTCPYLAGVAQTNGDSVHLMKIHFLYGSKPARGYKKTESKWFGGIHGGHVSIELDSLEIGFGPYSDFHIFAHRNAIAGKFFAEPLEYWKNDTTGYQYLSILVPLTHEQYTRINATHRQYLNQCPYDYAFIGMRCASATYDILSQAGFFPVYSKSKNIRCHFYPKPLRKKLKRWAAQKGYTMVFHQGTERRKWEKD